jgi:hypothetical protein
MLRHGRVRLSVEAPLVPRTPDEETNIGLL